MDRCIAPEQTPDWQLEAYLDGEAPSELRQHLAVCANCAARLADLKRLTRSLERGLSRVTCPDTDQLRAYRWHHLMPEQELAIEKHLASCTACMREVASYIGPLSTRAARGTGVASTPSRRITMLVASLIPAAAMPLPQVRGTQSGAMVYQVKENDWQLVLEQATEARGYVLSGQLLGPEAVILSSAHAMVLANGIVTQETDLDASGWFDLRPLAPGRYELWIEAPDVRIRVLQIDLEKPP